jgi:chromate transporter
VFYLRLMGVFFKIGLLTIGGGYAMLPLIQREIIDRGWLTAREFVHIITIAEMTPGPIAINAATFVGYRLAGVKGSVLTTTAISLPSLLIILAVSKFLTHFEDHPTVQKVFYGLRPAVAGLVSSAAIFICREVLFGSRNLTGGAALDPRLGAIALISFISLRKLKVHPILTIVMAAIIGLLFLR